MDGMQKALESSAEIRGLIYVNAISLHLIFKQFSVVEFSYNLFGFTTYRNVSYQSSAAKGLSFPCM
jgi:hypothetical protein